ncbi:nucleotide 5'-monophosphate nucleosidase PpnN [Candidatus Dojkabacteria bacterium]|nr:nucleotide 5'-monophosphate nucleosidase PpnN [Candidatus Dojkabacteria bacterium]
MKYPTIDAQIKTEGRLDVLSNSEVNKIFVASRGSLYKTFRNCSLAVLNCGSDMDDGKQLLERYSTFDIGVVSNPQGIKLEVKGAPAQAFVDGKMIKGINQHLFAVLRDIIYTSVEIDNNPKFDMDTSSGISNAVFHILRNANVLQTTSDPNLVVCFGGHSINSEEYDYTKEVGYELGLRALDVCTGCGPGVMRGPMKGATIGHAKQRINNGRYLGITEPGIIAAEAPNAICNDLVILPDIEKRLEAFVRMGHGFIVFPGGPGTIEEILYLLGILLHPDNKDIPFPLIFTGPKSSAEYFKAIDMFISGILGNAAQRYYKIIIDNPTQVAQEILAGIKEVRTFREGRGDAFYFNWLLKINQTFQQPFLPTHENMSNLELHKNQPIHTLAAALRRAFSGIVSGNVKDDGIEAIKQHGKFQLSGDPDIMKLMDSLLTSFVDQNRMKLPGEIYSPCYQIIK